MTELKTWVNKREITVHCPACGKTEFFVPKCFGKMWEEYRRCRHCNLDILIENQHLIKMIMEDVIDND